MGLLAFGEFEADAERFELRRAGVLVETSAKCFDVLIYLIRHRERVVSKAELAEKVWQAQALSASAVPTAVLALRRTLGDDEDSARHIANVRGRGYRFVAEVRAVTPLTLGRSDGSEATGAARSSRSTFVGRSSEMAALSAAFERACGRLPQVVLLAGEAGIGKTRTAEEFAARARASDAMVLVGRCREGEGAPAFWPWVQIVRSLLEQSEPAVLENDVRPLAPVLAQMVPEVASHLPGLEPPPPLDPEPARFRLFDTVTQLIQRVGSERALVIVFDDLHRADPASLQLLAFVSRELRDAKVLVLVAYRDVEAQRDPPRLNVIAELARQEPSRAIQLHGFTAVEVDEFLAVSSRRGSGGEELALSLLEQSGGNPFFLTQLVHLLEAEGTGARAEKLARLSTVLPSGVREAIGRQLDGLPPETSAALRVASAVGREFSAPLVAGVLDHSVQHLIAALEPALDARMVVASDRRNHFRFAHVLLRDSIYEGINTQERGTLHHKIGETLERLYADDVGPHSAELAYHYLEAVHECGTERAVDYAVNAGEWASKRLAYEDAARHYRSAFQILEHAGPGNLERRCELLLDLGEVEMHAGERDRSRKTLYDAAALAKRVQHPGLLARAALRLAPGFFTIETGVFDSILVDLLEDAIEALGPIDSVLRAQLLARLAMALSWSDAEERRSKLTAEAITVAQRVTDSGAIAYAFSARHGLLWGPERLSERIALIAIMGNFASESKDVELILMHLLFRITASLEQGQIEEVDRDIAEYTRLAVPLNQPQSLWYTRVFRAARTLMQGRFSEAAKYSEEMLAIGARAQDANAMHSFAVHVAVQLWEQARAAEIIAHANSILDHYPRISGWHYSRAAMRFEAGDINDARADFERLAAGEFEGLPRNEEWSISACLIADVCFGLGDRRRAEILYSKLLPGSEQGCVIGFGIAYFGTVARRLGNLASTMHRWKEAEEHYAFALAREESIGARPWVAHVLYDHSMMLVARGTRMDRALAVELHSRGRGIADELKLVHLARKLGALGRRLEQQS